MKRQERSIFNTNGNLFEFFYLLTNISPAKGYLFIILWMFQWIILFAAPFMEIFDQTEAKFLAKFFLNFSILSHIRDSFDFKIISYILFTIIFLAFALIGYYVIKCRPNQKIRINEIILKISHIFLMATGTVLLPINTDLLAFCIKSIILNDKYPKYKSISTEFLPANASTYALISVLSISVILNLFMAIINILFCQDRSILNKLFWSPSKIYADLTMLFIHIFGRCYFILVSDVF